jgi:hypothetical protein
MLTAKRGPWLALAMVLLAFVAGCKDDITAPTQGFLRVRANVTNAVDVYVDGERVGTLGNSALGPLPAGTYRVAVERECYAPSPLEIEIEVAPGRTVLADFELTPEPDGFGSAQLTAYDEVSGEPIDGAAIWLETGSGFIDTGMTTPGRVDNVPCGPNRFQLREPNRASKTVGVSIPVQAVRDVTAELGPKRAVLAEMFTYQTCPNCPVAAMELEELHEEFPGQVYVVEWHTWSFPAFSALYHPDGVAREAEYGGGNGWPSTLFQGELPLIIGSQAANLQAFHDRVDAELAACENDCAIALVASAQIDASSASITAKIKWRGGALPADVRVRFVLIENDVNAPGNQPDFDFAGRAFAESPLVFGAPGEILERSATFSVSPSWDVSSLGYVVYVQSISDTAGTQEVLAVTGS